MKLTRRDALAALISAGVLTGGGVAALHREWEPPGGEGSSGDEVLATLVDVAHVVYPSAVSNVESFVETFATERFRARPDHFSAVGDAVAALDDHTRVFYDADRFLALEESTQSAVLTGLGADTADPDPDGSTAERVRFYLVNEVLYALFTSPTGGKLVGIENPQGHPGGTGSYRRGPDR